MRRPGESAATPTVDVQPCLWQRGWLLLFARKSVPLALKQKLKIFHAATPNGGQRHAPRNLVCACCGRHDAHISMLHKAVGAMRSRPRAACPAGDALRGRSCLGQHVASIAYSHAPRTARNGRPSSLPNSGRPKGPGRWPHCHPEQTQLQIGAGCVGRLCPNLCQARHFWPSARPLRVTAPAVPAERRRRRCQRECL